MTVFYTYFVHNIKKQFLPIKTVKVVDIIILIIIIDLFRAPQLSDNQQYTSFFPDK